MPLKLLHTSDWHLGKKLFKLERLPEQALFLRWLLNTVQSQGIHHLLVAGDIFDVPQPPHKALRLFYDFIAEFTATTTAHVWIIGGNHDSGALLEAPLALIDEERVHIWGRMRETPSEHWAKMFFPQGKKHVDLCLLPYFRQHDLMPWREFHAGENAEAMVQDFLSRAPQSNQSAGRLLLAHHLFGMFEAAGSEQALALSGLESVPLDWLRAFNYAALGHIHKPQILRHQNPTVWYSGSPIPLRFSETAPKQVNLLHWNEDSTFACEPLKLPTWRPLHTLETNEADWVKDIESLPLASDLPPALEIHLRLAAPVPGLLENIRATSEARGLEVLGIIPSFIASEETQEEGRDWTTLLQLSPMELFEDFYHSKFPQAGAVPEELKRDISDLLQEARHAPPSA